MTDIQNKLVREEYERIKRAGSLGVFHYLILGGSLVLTLSAWYFTSKQVEEKVARQFTRESSQILELIRERMQKYEEALLSGTALITSNNYSIQHTRWKAFADSLKLTERYPGINGIGVIFSVDPSQKSEFIKNQKRQQPGFRIYPNHEQTELLPITYIEPSESNRLAIGLDMAHETNRYTAARQARLTGRPTITGPIVLVQDQGKTPGFLFFAPFYKKGTPDNPNFRKKNFLGMVYAPFVVKSLMEGTLAKAKRRVGFKILDGETPIYDEHKANAPDFDPNPLFKKEFKLDFYGRTWVIDIWSLKSFRKYSENYQPTFILIGGITLDILLLTIFFLLTRANRRAIDFAHRLKEDVIEQRNAVLNSAKMASMGEMAGSIAHEINNPLAIIQGYTEKMRLLTKKISDKDIKQKFEHHLEKNLEVVNRITMIVRGMRDFARDGSHDPFENFTTTQIVDDALNFTRERINKEGIELRVDTTQEATVSCQKIQISQVIVNLLNNAKSAIKTLEDKWIDIRVTAEDNQVLISITDSGSGISKENQEKIFQPFYTTKIIGEGTGLGLSLSQGIIESHNGSLTYDKDCEHTCFVIRLPRAESAQLLHKSAA